MATPSSSMQNPELPEQEEERKWTTSTARLMKISRHTALPGHRHTPEIEEQLSYAAGYPITLNFTPHLVPMNRGILVTAYASLKKDVTYEEVKAVYDKYYANEQFVRVLDKDVCPQTKWVEGSNYVDVNFKIDPRTKRIIMMGAMDNLVKGAAGQAVQNMNLMFGLPENEGLCMPPMFP